MREYYFVNFGNDQNEIFTKEQFSNFISTAVCHNKDIQSFMVTMIDSRLTPFQALMIASKFNLADEVAMELEKGLHPKDALFEWVK